MSSTNDAELDARRMSHTAASEAEALELGSDTSGVLADVKVDEMKDVKQVGKDEVKEMEEVGKEELSREASITYESSVTMVKSPTKTNEKGDEFYELDDPKETENKKKKEEGEEKEKEKKERTKNKSSAVMKFPTEGDVSSPSHAKQQNGGGRGSEKKVQSKHSVSPKKKNTANNTNNSSENQSGAKSRKEETSPKAQHMSNAKLQPHAPPTGTKSQGRLIQNSSKVSPTRQQKHDGQQELRPVRAESVGRNKEDGSHSHRCEELGRHRESHTQQNFIKYFAEMYIKPVRSPPCRQKPARHSSGTKEKSKKPLHAAARVQESRADGGGVRRDEEHPLIEEAHGWHRNNPSSMKNESNDGKGKWVPFSRGVSHLSSMSTVPMSSGRRDPVEDPLASQSQTQICLSMPALQAKRQYDSFQRCIHELLERCNNRDENETVPNLGYSYRCILAGKRRHIFSRSPDNNGHTNRSTLPPAHQQRGVVSGQTLETDENFHELDDMPVYPMDTSPETSKSQPSIPKDEHVGLPNLRLTKGGNQDSSAALESEINKQRSETNSSREMQSWEELDVNTDDERCEELIT